MRVQMRSRQRDRRYIQKLNREKETLLPVSAPLRHDVRDRVAWLNAQLALATKNNDREEIERLEPICLAAREEFRALIAVEKSESPQAAISG